MSFNSLQFAGFFLLVWITTWLLGRRRAPKQERRPVADVARRIRRRNLALLVASYTFYGAWDARFLSLIAISTAVDFVCGRGMTAAPEARRRRLLIVSLSCNLGLLGVFKYFDFFAGSLADLLGRVGIEADPFLLDVVLPVGISFYTFQTLSYTIDIYRRRIEPVESVLEFANFVAFFPQLVAGPIERARNLLPQFAEERPITARRVERGLHWIGSGLLKKVVVADNMALVADAVFALPDPSGLQTLIGVYAFAFQIYGDFAGYSDIARGTACCLGFDISQNFDLPYFASTPREFWRRWHISLSSWLRDYLYISLGGNRLGSLTTYRNLMLTMVLGGLWHGAAWTFVAWGLFHGGILCLYRLVEEPIRRRLPTSEVAASATRVLGIAFYFQLTAIGWLLFRAASLDQAWGMFTSLFISPFDVGEPGAIGPWQTALLVGASLVLLQIVGYRRKEELVWFDLQPSIRGAVYAAAVLAFVWLGHGGEAPFIYFQF